MKTIMQLIKNNDENGGKLMFDLYTNWDVSGDSQEITIADGTKRKSWPKHWDVIAKEMADLGMTEAEIHAIKEETVDNKAKPWLSEECITWPGIQNVVREAWCHVHGEWKPQEHFEHWFALCRVLSLNVKNEGLSKMFQESGAEIFVAMIWATYQAWPSPPGEDKEVIRYNRKTMEDAEKRTWPLPFEGELSVTSLMKSLDGNEGSDGDLILAYLKTVLFDQGAHHQIHPNCTPEQVCWPDLQQAFRSAISEDAWDSHLSEEYPPLAYNITLRLKIMREQIAELLTGPWRMYAKQDGGNPFSYGLVIRDVNLDSMTFEATAQDKGKYEVVDGKLDHDAESGRVNISYTEIWPNGDRDELTARVKSNGKFQCESKDGYEQKATREDLNLPAEEARKKKHKKYYL